MPAFTALMFSKEVIAVGYELKVAMLIWSYWPGHEGGAERQCRKIIPYLERQGIQVVVWTARTQRKQRRREMVGDHEIVRMGWAVPLMIAARGWVEKLMAKVLRGTNLPGRGQARRREALLFWLALPMTFVARTFFLLELWCWLRKAENRPDAIHVHESSWLAGAAAYVARRYGIPVLAKTATYPAWNVLGYDVPMRRTFSKARLECHFAALAPYLAEDLIAHGVPRERIFEVPNGVEIPERIADFSSEKVVLFVANFSQGVELKAFDVLLDAWLIVAKEEPNARLFLLGGGERTLWEDMVKTMKLEASVVFVGWTPDPTEYYRRAGLFVLPSRVEGISNALLEAQSFGLACVVSDIPGNVAVVENEVTGLVVPVGDSGQLAEAVSGLLKDPDKRKKLGLAGRNRAQTIFSIVGVSKRLTDVYKTISSSREM
jgi:glycosyltransferase involved in cell wall biosynthesis